MRTKTEIAEILAKRRTASALSSSTWNDLVTSIQGFTVEQKDNFVKMIATGDAKKAGELLKRALYENAKDRAQAEVSTMLSDDSLTLEELDSLI